MTKFDRMSSLFWMGVSFCICTGALRMGPGSLLNPGPGFVPLGSGLLIGIFGAMIFILTFKKPPGEKEISWKLGSQWRKVAYTMGSILGYAFLIDLFGFHLVTFLWLAYVCWKIGEMGWKKAIATALIATFFSYLLFERYLGIHFSKGVLGF